MKLRTLIEGESLLNDGASVAGGGMNGIFYHVMYTPTCKQRAHDDVHTTCTRRAHNVHKTYTRSPHATY